MKYIKTSYECGQCYNVHDYEDEARECCPPTVKEVYLCPECEDAHNSREDAAECCPDEEADDSVLSMASPKELEMAGQRRLPL